MPHVGIELFPGAARAALEATGAPLAVTSTPALELELDTAAIDQALRTKGTNQGGLYGFSFVRKENVMDHGRVVPAGLG